jgi:hypothetical protein
VALDRDAQRGLVGGGADRVLPDLPSRTGQGHGDADVLARSVRSYRGVGFEQERGDVVGVLVDTGDGVRRQRAGEAAARPLVLARLLGDQQAGEQPEDLVPRGDHVRGGGVAEDFADRGHQVAAHHDVLAGRHAERGVLVGDPADDGGQRHRFHPGEVPGHGGDGHRERLPLLAVGLVAAVEQVEQFRVRFEHPVVEPAGDLRAVAHDGVGRGADDADRVGGEHQGDLQRSTAKKRISDTSLKPAPTNVITDSERQSNTVNTGLLRSRPCGSPGERTSPCAC